LPKGGRGLTDIDRNIEHFALYHAFQFALRLQDLEMQAAQDVFD
jgi:hypothetical protein